MSISEFYRNFIEKSRSFVSKHLSGKRRDLYLFLAMIAVLAAILAVRVVKTTAQPKKTDLLIAPQFADLFGSDVASALFAEFEGQNPHLRIKIPEPGTPADIIIFDDDVFGSLLKQDEPALTSLAPYMYSEAQTEPARRAALWAVPLVSFMDLFFYNIDILTAADCFRPPKTRAEFLDVARAVSKAFSGGETVFPLALGLGDEETPSGIQQALRRDIYPWIWADSPGIFSEAGGGLSRAADAAITFFGQLNREGLLAPGTFETTGAQRLEEFADGKIAMMAVSARDLAFVQGRGVNFGVTAMPAAAQGKNRLGLSVIYAGISAGSTMPDEAWAFIIFIADKGPLLAEALGAVPGYYPGAINIEYIDRDPLLSKAWDIFEAADIAEQHPADPAEAENAALLWDKLVEVLFY